MSTTGSAVIEIAAPPAVVWSAVTDITRMGEWSPECVAARWAGGATGPAVGAEFEGDNVVKLGGRAIKKWTTTSKVTACDPGRLFEFLAEGHTTWRYEFAPSGTGTRVTESFGYEAHGLQGFFYDKIVRRPRAMVRGMQRTLEHIRASLTAA